MGQRVYKEVAVWSSGCMKKWAYETMDVEMPNTAMDAYVHRPFAHSSMHLLPHMFIVPYSHGAVQPMLHTAFVPFVH